MSDDVPGATDAAASRRRSSGVAPGADPKVGEHGSGAARTMNALASLVLAGATFAVLFAAMPALVRAALPGDVRSTRARGAERFVPHRSKLPGASHPPLNVLNDDVERDARGVPIDDLDRAPGLPSQPMLQFDDPGARDRAGGADRRETRESSTRMGLARQALKLRKSPANDGLVLDEIKAGEQVVIVKEAGAWALVVHSGKMGWTRMSEIAVR